MTLDSKKVAADFTAGVLTLGARIVGGAFTLFGFGLLMWALVVGDDRWSDTFLGAILLVVGISLLVIPRLEDSKLEKWRKTMEPGEARKDPRRPL